MSRSRSRSRSRATATVVESPSAARGAEAAGAAKAPSAARAAGATSAAPVEFTASSLHRKLADARRTDRMKSADLPESGDDLPDLDERQAREDAMRAGNERLATRLTAEAKASSSHSELPAPDSWMSYLERVQQIAKAEKRLCFFVVDT